MWQGLLKKLSLSLLYSSFIEDLFDLIIKHLFLPLLRAISSLFFKFVLKDFFYLSKLVLVFSLLHFFSDFHTHSYPPSTTPSPSLIRIAIFCLALLLFPVLQYLRKFYLSNRYVARDERRIPKAAEQQPTWLRCLHVTSCIMTPLYERLMVEHDQQQPWCVVYLEQSCISMIVAFAYR
jgi:hypothetical protein